MHTHTLLTSLRQGKAILILQTKISTTRTKESFSENDCHSIFSVKSVIFFNFLTLNLVLQKANYKRMKEQDSFIFIWHEIREPFQGYWVPVNNPPTHPQDGNNTKTKRSSLVPTLHKTAKIRARKFNCFQEMRTVKSQMAEFKCQ